MNSHLKEKIDIHLGILRKSKPLEDYCNKCGDCCKPSVKVTKSGNATKILVDGLSCKFLEKGSNSCKVYPDRLKKANWCVDLKTMLKKGLAPADCPYVKGLRGYSPTQKLSDELKKSVVPLLRLAISRGPKAPYDKKDLREFLGE